MFLTQNRRRYRYDDANERGRKDGQFTAYGTGVCKDNACHRKCTPRCPHFEFCRASDGLCSPPQSDGAACAKDTECLSFCVDGVCKGRELGAPCQNRMECDSRFCWDGECRRDDLEVGDKCDVHWVCASRACHNGTCKPGNLKDYEQCYIPEQCASRYCPGECRPLAVDAGGKCHAGMQCKSKLCLDGTCGRTKVDNGGTCRDDRECARYRCIYGKCAAERVSLGGRCTLDSECESGYCNEHNKCAVSTGQPCKSKDDCRGRGETYCSSSTKKCGHSRLHGQYCSTTEQCLRGLCCVGGKCDNCPGKEFAACSRHSDCEAGLSCFQSVEFPERKQCGPPDGRLRSPCSAKHPCRGSLQCRGGQCLPERWSPKTVKRALHKEKSIDNDILTLGQNYPLKTVIPLPPSIP
ncbi:hypothetical protein N7445_006173 [Penicillium cf. griseofulvum]|nr:hypothetical protein N7445_006173 [Penicillium cf. griseofulvum]